MASLLAQYTYLSPLLYDIPWRSTTLRALSDNMIVIPNAELARAKVTNFDLADREMSIIVPVEVSCDSALERVEKITVDVARKVLGEIEGGVTDVEPRIRCGALADSSVNFHAVLRVKTFADQFRVCHEFIKRLHRRYREEGIEIPFPIRTIHRKDEGREGKRGDS